ncbi:protein O-mannosyltransferase 1-like [Mya arenaria]|uniref:protein O-mannosyltransferase 1-like n=1 Tax=Mya arenaria TaxID=6604 RepID=UPI0022E78296|nr:protein O-mannosyltransferase 1-like [Mya arenaria]
MAETNKESESEEKTETTKQKQDEKQPFTVKLEVDCMQIVLFLAALATRTWQIGVPRAVVFDELHFAKFVSLYLRRIFFFDTHPPLGKMILAFAGGYMGFEGDIGFDRIGAGFPPDYPVREVRLVPAVCGSMVVPLVYQIAVELGLSRWAALLAGSFILLDNALLVQSRFMLMEGMLLCFMCIALLGFLKFRNLAHREFSLMWWFWLCVTGLGFTCALSVKYVGFFTGVLIVYLAGKDYWRMIGDFSRSDANLVKHLAARVCMFGVVPCALYVYIFYLHLSTLTKAGPHDNVMTSAFQASLEGGLATLTKGQPLYVAFGSQITLRHTYDPSPGKPCWLHSHAHVYPVRYKDGRGSSHQQQVTCYYFKDVNNWWIVKHPDRDEMVVDDPVQPVKHGDVIQLVHGLSSRALNSHDVAAPMTPQCQEVSCYINYNVSMPAQSLWKVEIVNRGDDGSKWETIKSQVRLIHIKTGQALKITGNVLPEWGFNQLEVATDRIVQQEATIWNVEEHRYTKDEDKDLQMASLQLSEMIPTKPTELSFWEKFIELQLKMLFVSADKEMEHKYASSPLEWPLMNKNVAYWMSGNSNAQIHLLGNIFIWVCGTLSLVVLSAFLVFYLLRRRRLVCDLEEGAWSQFPFVWELVTVGYLLHFLPHFLTDRTLFLHHYLPCVIFKVLAVAALVNHVEVCIRRSPYVRYVTCNVVVILIAGATWVFRELCVVSYGNTDITPTDIERLTWLESWDFLQHTM